MSSELHLADPFSVVPDGFDRGQIARVEDVPGRRQEASPAQVVPGVAGTDRHELEDARISIAIDHAAGAAVADQLRRVELVNVADGRLPEVAAVKVQFPVEIDILVP